MMPLTRFVAAKLDAENIHQKEKHCGHLHKKIKPAINCALKLERHGNRRNKAEKLRAQGHGWNTFDVFAIDLPSEFLRRLNDDEFSDYKRGCDELRSSILRLTKRGVV